MNTILYALVVAIIVLAIVGAFVLRSRALNTSDTSVQRSSLTMLVILVFVLVGTIVFAFVALPGMNL